MGKIQLVGGFQEEHKERVVKEANDLAEKIDALDFFIYENPFYQTLDPAEARRLLKQLTLMELYHDILVERYENF